MNTDTLWEASLQQAWILLSCQTPLTTSDLRKTPKYATSWIKVKRKLLVKCHCFVKLLDYLCILTSPIFRLYVSCKYLFLHLFSFTFIFRCHSAVLTLRLGFLHKNHLVWVRGKQLLQLQLQMVRLYLWQIPGSDQQLNAWTCSAILWKTPSFGCRFWFWLIQKMPEMVQLSMTNIWFRSLEISKTQTAVARLAAL